MIKVTPAVLPKTFQELEATLARLKGIVSTVQIDVVDGIFAPSKTWPYGQDGKEELEKILSQERSLPFWQDFDFEFDLMVADALAVVDTWVRAGAARIIVHAKSKNTREALGSLQQLRGEGKGFISVGLALSAHDTPDTAAPFEGLYDFLQVMGIDKEGVQGQPPDPHHRSTLLIQKLRTEDPHRTISVDGGVRMENISELVTAGANRLVVGSLLLKQENLHEALRNIIAEANHHGTI